MTDAYTDVQKLRYALQNAFLNIHVGQFKNLWPQLLSYPKQQRRRIVESALPRRKNIDKYVDLAFRLQHSLQRKQTFSGYKKKLSDNALFLFFLLQIFPDNMKIRELLTETKKLLANLRIQNVINQRFHSLTQHLDNVGRFNQISRAIQNDALLLPLQQRRPVLQRLQYYKNVLFYPNTRQEAQYKIQNVFQKLKSDILRHEPGRFRRLLWQRSEKNGVFSFLDGLVHEYGLPPISQKISQLKQLVDEPLQPAEWSM